MNHTFKKKGKYIFIPFAVIGAIALVGYVVMWLWNYTLPGLISGVGIITYWKAIGLLVLCRLLFGGFKGGGGGRHNFKNGFAMREKMKNMSEEDREKFKAAWKARCEAKGENS